MKSKLILTRQINKSIKEEPFFLGATIEYKATELHLYFDVLKGNEYAKGRLQKELFLPDIL